MKKFFFLVVLVFVTTLTNSQAQSQIEKRFNRHFEEVKRVYLHDGLISILPNENAKECVIYAFKKHTNYRLVYRFAEHKGYLIPSQSDLPEIMKMKGRSNLLDYRRIVAFSPQESLPVDYSLGQELVQVMFFKDNIWSIQYCALKSNWRRGYQMIFFEQ